MPLGRHALAFGLKLKKVRPPYGPMHYDLISVATDAKLAELYPGRAEVALLKTPKLKGRKRSLAVRYVKTKNVTEAFRLAKSIETSRTRA
jgi:hypothetical protein